MPKDQLNMKFDVRFTASIRQDKRSIDSIFDRIAPGSTKTGQPIVTLDKVYTTYGQPIMREIVRTTMAKYTINEVSSSREAVNAELTAAVLKAMEGTPITIRRFAMADIQYPDVITNQMELNAERQQKIAAEEAQKQIELVKLSTALEVAKLNRKVRREKAEAAREENKIYSDSVTDKYLEYRRLEVLEKMAENPNTVFVPFDALGTVGMSNKVFRDGGR